MGSCFWPLTSASRGDSRISSSSRKRVYNFVAREDRSNDVATKLQLTSFSLTPRLGALGTLNTLDAAKEDVNQKWNVQFLELISRIPQRRPEVATVISRSLAASLNGELVFLFSYFSYRIFDPFYFKRHI